MYLIYAVLLKATPFIKSYHAILNLFHKKHCKINSVQCLQMCSSANISFFHIRYQHSLSTQPESHSQCLRKEQLHEGWRRGQASKRLLTCLAPHKAAAAKNEKSHTSSSLLMCHYHRPILSCVQQSFLPTVHHSDGKAQPYTVRHLSQSSGILATAIQLSTFDTRKACMVLHNALFRELLFPREGKIPSRNFS